MVVVTHVLQWTGCVKQFFMQIARTCLSPTVVFLNIFTSGEIVDCCCIGGRNYGLFAKLSLWSYGPGPRGWMCQLFFPV